jgi:hypothetical protein
LSVNVAKNLPRLILHIFNQRLHFHQRFSDSNSRSHEIDSRIDEQHSPRREDTRRARDDNFLEAKFTRQQRAVHRPTAAVDDEREVARIMAALYRNEFQSVAHVGVHQPQRTNGGSSVFSPSAAPKVAYAARARSRFTFNCPPRK